ncbi:MAG: hypothetical protein KKD44_22785 [Proteobacteria bacterium]|nr:hypothetical protein [Pseudomonadota bacterium]
METLLRRIGPFLGLIFFLVAIAIVHVFKYRKPVTIRGVNITLPSPAMTLGQTLTGMVDLILASLCLYVFLDHATKGKQK